MSKLELAQIAQEGYASADLYETYRPSYPAEAVEKLLQHLEIAGVEGAKVLDLAAGTGKFTEILVNRPECFDIAAVEPHDEMRKQLMRKALPNVQVLQCTAEALSAIEDSSQAAVITAQAFHWFSNMAALKEIARVLKPGGFFGAIWTIEGYNAPMSWEVEPGWSTVMRNLVWGFEDGTPRFRHMEWRNVFEEQWRGGSLVNSNPLFGLPIGEDCVESRTWISKEDMWHRLKTLSQIAVLEGEALEAVKRVYDEAVESKESEKDKQGRISVHTRTFFVWTRKLPAEPLAHCGGVEIPVARKIAV